MTIRFKGQHIDKRCVTYKREGGGFQADALCDNGYCYQVYMRNDPAPTKYLDLGLSPLHSRTMWLFDYLKDDHHHVGMDNLYNSVMFCKAAFRHSKQVMCHGELKSIRAEREAWGTVKAAVLEGNPECAFLIASSVYDTKPVHYLSMVTSVIEGVEKEKVVYNVDTEQKEKMKFLHLNQLDTYNHGMGGIADQLRGVYRLDRWVQNRKWWWSVMFWAIGVLLTNDYKLYLSVCKEAGVKKPRYGAHYDFRWAVGEYWVNRDAVGTEAEARMFFIASTPGSASGVSPLSSPSTSACGSASGEDGSFKPVRVNDKALADGGLLSCRCATCNVHLCINSYGTFHQATDILSQKAMLKNNYEKEATRQKKKYKYCFKFTTPFYLCGNGMGFCWSLWCFLGGGGGGGGGNDDTDCKIFYVPKSHFNCNLDLGDSKYQGDTAYFGDLDRGQMNNNNNNNTAATPASKLQDLSMPPIQVSSPLRLSDTYKPQKEGTDSSRYQGDTAYFGDFDWGQMNNNSSNNNTAANPPSKLQHQLMPPIERGGTNSSRYQGDTIYFGDLDWGKMNNNNNNNNTVANPPSELKDQSMMPIKAGSRIFRCHQSNNNNNDNTAANPPSEIQDHSMPPIEVPSPLLLSEAYTPQKEWTDSSKYQGDTAYLGDLHWGPKTTNNNNNNNTAANPPSEIQDHSIPPIKVLSPLLPSNAYMPQKEGTDSSRYQGDVAHFCNFDWG
eukprot:jgi/Psemu1/8122/gm1.8122_g